MSDRAVGGGGGHRRDVVIERPIDDGGEVRSVRRVDAAHGPVGTASNGEAVELLEVGV